MILIGCLMQWVAYAMSDSSSLLSFFSGVFGVFSVVLCAHKKVTFYLWAYLQLITYSILAYNQKLYGEVMENAFYAITMVPGLIYWKRHSKDLEVKVFHIKTVHRVAIYALCLVAIVVMRYGLVWFTDDSQPTLDAITTVPAFFAHMLMLMRIRDQWILWTIINVGSIFMWMHAMDLCMVAQFIFWTFNSVYGWIVWRK